VVLVEEALLQEKVVLEEVQLKKWRFFRQSSKTFWKFWWLT
jgi:hypothetical protein